MDKVAIFESARLGYHHCEEGVGGNIERNTQEYIGRTLIKLAAEATVGYIELEKDMAGREVHQGQFAYIPCRNKEAAGVRVAFYLVDEVSDLVDVRAVGAAPRTPLVTVNGSQLPVFASPFVPDTYLVVVEVLHICVAPKEPKQLIYD